MTLYEDLLTIGARQVVGGSLNLNPRVCQLYVGTPVFGRRIQHQLLPSRCLERRRTGDEVGQLKGFLPHDHSTDRVRHVEPARRGHLQSKGGVGRQETVHYQQPRSVFEFRPGREVAV